MRKLFPKLINVGVTHATSIRQRRNIQLTNFIALGLISCMILIIIFRYLNGELQNWFFFPLIFETILFAVLILLNHVGATTVSRILICWAPAMILLIDVKILFTHLRVAESSQYVGLRLFQVAFSFFPFLVFNLSERILLTIAASVPAFCAIFYDKILEALGVGYTQVGLHETSYYYNNFRTILSLSLIAAAFIFLKQLLERQERRNEHLIQELAVKNLELQRSTERELKRAYDRLSFHINNTPLAVIERDKNFNIIFWNRRAQDLFGWSADEVMGKRPMDFLIDTRDLDFSMRAMMAAIDTKSEADLMELRTVTKSGEVKNCLWYYSFLRDESGELETILSFASDITAQRSANYSLNERIKELRTLYSVSQLLTTSGKSMPEVFATFPALLPNGWQYPELCAARLTVFDQYFETANFEDTRFQQSGVIKIDDQVIGSLQIVYLKETPNEYEGPFFKEERDLLTTIVQMLQVYIERKIEEERLEKERANMHATINNTEIMIWSVDDNFKLLSYNEPFKRYNEGRFKFKVYTGMDHRNYFDAALAKKWTERYMRAMAGEIVSIEETIQGTDYRFSLSPIIERGKVAGVSVFADDITSKNQQNKALTEANKKISELRMMALRSVMNPHFIFNVLSSIQFFITKNDQLNALNYLTSFSKLMRTVLTRSVAETVSAKEELDMLQEYICLEMLRFDEKFDFKVEYDEELDLDSYQIPSLLIQPYVENAILHGLYNKECAGMLTLRVKTEEEYIIFEVEDDGIGRALAAQIKARNVVSRKSMGTQLTEERLKLFNGTDENPVTFYDLMKEGKAAGTLACIKIKAHLN
ncbi:PAS domain S-box protein [Pseudochryseolinea flava]|uniref:PAS domain-containing protein n=1 Tax=Pseudochryseolinea flava TaxID=2059302 RepID=A0A364Y9H7_9BACT|nr:PAS domain S-box protein [Pseudochryseolinea flava]RAW02872.1 hypothetical protein DQQ10_01825 [Pseudochryseolinea flava]